MIIEQNHFINLKNGRKNTKKFLFLHFMCNSMPRMEEPVLQVISLRCGNMFNI